MMRGNFLVLRSSKSSKIVTRIFNHECTHHKSSSKFFLSQFTPFSGKGYLFSENMGVMYWVGVFSCACTHTSQKSLRFFPIRAKFLLQFTPFSGKCHLFSENMGVMYCAGVFFLVHAKDRILVEYFLIRNEKVWNGRTVFKVFGSGTIPPL